MLDKTLKKFGAKISFTVKGAVAFLLVVLAVALPQIAHACGGAAAGAKYLPMYAPALLAGCILGWKWGLGVGVLSPVVSFGFTSLALGSAMPAAERLPYMVLELAVFGLVSGLFAKKIQNNEWLAFPAVVCAQLCGRATYIIYNLIAGRQFSALISSVQGGLVGLYIQAVAVPFAVIILAIILKHTEKNND